MTPEQNAALDQLHLQPFQQRTALYAYKKMFEQQQARFLIADEVGLGKTKAAQGLIALATLEQQGNVLYLASSGHIVRQNLKRLATHNVQPLMEHSLSLLAEKVYENDIQGKIIGLTPIKDLRADHFGSMHERGLLYRLLLSLHRPLKSDGLFEFFKGGRFNEGLFHDYTTKQLPTGLRAAFENHLDGELITHLSDPRLRNRHKREIVGGLRATLALCALEKLAPALVVVDEIQRFSDILMATRPTPQVGFLLTRKMLVLSATPYQPGASGDHSGPDPHKGFLQLVTFLNERRPKKVADVKQALARTRAALLEPSIDKGQLATAVLELETHLRSFMVRTERPANVHVKRYSVPAPLNAEDLKSLKQAMQLLKRAVASSKNKRHRFPEFIELWKSAPYLLSSLGERYVAGKDIKKVISKRPPVPAAYSVQQLKRQTPLGNVPHPRLRAMVQDMGQDARVRRLWLPPTLPYILDPTRIGDDPPSKTLIFTAWGAAPPAIATALNLLVEPRPIREQNLEWRNFKDGSSETVNSVYAIAAPLWRFAQTCDPLAAMDSIGPLPPPQMVARIRKQMENSGLISVTRARRKGKAIDIAIDLNVIACYPHPTALQRPYLEPARALMLGKTHHTTATVNAAQANLLAELAAAAPGTCACRALQRAIPQLKDDKQPQLLAALSVASLHIGHSITRLLQRPLAAAIVEGTRPGKKMAYWHKVLRYCLNHDLQSVLDEYVFLLASENSSVSDPAKLAWQIAQDIELALGTTGSLQAIRPEPREKSYNAAMYARALGENDTLPDEDDLKARQKSKAKASRPVPGKPKRPRGRLGSPLLAAFNSPFPPFVLTTTSTGQEGLDMHRYCRRLVHWNLPNSPLSLEQREGRIDRYLSLGVRTSIAKLDATLDKSGINPNFSKKFGISPWTRLLDAARVKGDTHELAPFWHFGDEQPIKAVAINIPFSREATAWERLQEEASWYRLVLGQPDPHDLLARLSNSSDGNREAITGVKLDLSPRLSLANKR